MLRAGARPGGVGDEERPLERPTTALFVHLCRGTRAALGASVTLVGLEHVERRLQGRPVALGPAPRAELLHVLMLPDFERADPIGEFWGYPESRAFAELLIDCQEDRTLRAVLVGMLRESDH